MFQTRGDLPNTGHIFSCEFFKWLFFRQLAANGHVWGVKILHSSQIFWWNHENAGKCITRLSSLGNVFWALLPATSALIDGGGWNFNHADASAQKIFSQIFRHFGPYLRDLRAFLCHTGPYFAIFEVFREIASRQGGHTATVVQANTWGKVPSRLAAKSGPMSNSLTMRGSR